MAGKKGAGENSKKAAGNAKKAEAAAAKQAVESAKKAKTEDEEWGKGAKSNAKKDAAEQKKADAARKKAEKDALLKEEEKSLPAAKTGNAKSAVKKTSKGLNLSQLDDGGDNNSSHESSKPSASLNASGIDNALDALSLTASSAGDKVERHPERRFPAAFAKFKETRLEQLKAEQPGLRKQQREDLAYKEFQKHPDNPYNQVTASYDTSKEELREIREKERAKVEGRLAGK